MTIETKRIRGFEEVPSEHVKITDVITKLPVRGDIGSAGYDFYAKETVTILPKTSHLFWTDVCAYMQQNEVLLIHVRSSIGIKKGLILKNVTGVIDSTYYANESNGGNIAIPLYNNSDYPVTIEKHERIAQGIFQNYLTVDDDNYLSDTRNGGFGSTGEK